MMNTLSQLQSSLQHYFPSLDIDKLAWVIYPFAVSEEVNLTTEEEEQLIELRHNKFYQTSFTNTTLEEFWLAIMKVYPLVSLKAVKTLLQFLSSWFCEFGFSALTEIKSKKRERLLTVDELRVCLSTLEPR